MTKNLHSMIKENFSIFNRNYLNRSHLHGIKPWWLLLVLNDSQTAFLRQAWDFTLHLQPTQTTACSSHYSDIFILILVFIFVSIFVFISVFIFIFSPIYLSDIFRLFAFFAFFSFRKTHDIWLWISWILFQLLLHVYH